MTLHHDKRIHKQQRIFFFDFGKKFSEIFFFWGPPLQTGLKSQDELEWTSPSRPACEKMVMDPVGWSLGAQNVEK